MPATSPVRGFPRQIRLSSSGMPAFRRATSWRAAYCPGPGERPLQRRGPSHDQGLDPTCLDSHNLLPHPGDAPPTSQARAVWARISVLASWPANDYTSNCSNESWLSHSSIPSDSGSLRKEASSASPRWRWGTRSAEGPLTGVIGSRSRAAVWIHKYAIGVSRQLDVKGTYQDLSLEMTRKTWRISRVKATAWKAVATVTGCKPYFRPEAGKMIPAPSGLQKVDGLNHLLGNPHPDPHSARQYTSQSPRRSPVSPGLRHFVIQTDADGSRIRYARPS